MDKIVNFLETFNAQLKAGDKIRKDREKALKEVVSNREEKVEKLQGMFEAINIQIEDNEEVLAGIMEEEAAEFNRLKDIQAQLHIDHKAGKIQLNELMEKKQKDSELELEAREKFKDKILLARTASAAVGEERLRIMSEIETEQEWIGIHVSTFFTQFTEILDRQKTMFAGYQRMGNFSENHRADYAVIKSGINSKKWEPASWKDLNGMVTSGIIRPEHFDQYDEMMRDLRVIELDFSLHRMTVIYHPVGSMLEEVGLSFRVHSRIKNQVITIPRKRPNPEQLEGRK